MTLLKSVLKSAFGSRTQPAPQPVPASPPVASSAPAPAPAPDHVWNLLDPETGVQASDYPDNPRTDIHALFGHPPRRVLDVGCAAGAVGLGIKQAFPGAWVWGCELNHKAAQLAKGRLDHVSEVPREQWTAGDLALVNQLDTVLLLDVLEHMYNPWAELKFLRERLPPGAQVVVSLPNAGHLSVLAGLSAGLFRYEPAGILDVTHIRFFTLQEMRAMFEQTGFRIEHETVLSSSPVQRPPSFPASVASGKLTLRVDTEQEWQGLMAVQFGFRLAAAPVAST